MKHQCIQACTDGAVAMAAVARGARRVVAVHSDLSAVQGIASSFKQHSHAVVIERLRACWLQAGREDHLKQALRQVPSRHRRDGCGMGGAFDLVIGCDVVPLSLLSALSLGSSRGDGGAVLSSKASRPGEIAGQAHWEAAGKKLCQDLRTAVRMVTTTRCSSDSSSNTAVPVQVSRLLLLQSAPCALSEMEIIDAAAIEGWETETIPAGAVNEVASAAALLGMSPPMVMLFRIPPLKGHA